MNTRKQFIREGFGLAAILSAQTAPAILVRSMTAARNGIAAAKRGWVNPYITDGLVAMWDGEWNAGGGVHDSSATTWIDLSGTGNANYPSSYTLDGNSFTFLASSSNRMPLFLPSVNGERTIEIVARAKDDTVFSNNPRWFSFVVRGSRLECDTTQSGNRTNFSFADKNEAFRNRLYYENISATTIQHIACSLSSDDIIFFVNGSVRTPTQGSSSNFLGDGENLFLGEYNYTSFMHEQVYCVRCYSKALNLDEISQNHDVDVVRFNIPTT